MNVYIYNIMNNILLVIFVGGAYKINLWKLVKLVSFIHIFFFLCHRSSNVYVCILCMHSHFSHSVSFSLFFDEQSMFAILLTLSTYFPLQKCKLVTIEMIIIATTVAAEEANRFRTVKYGIMMNCNVYIIVDILYAGKNLCHSIQIHF